jgi:hypothetical protein
MNSFNPPVFPLPVVYVPKRVEKNTGFANLLYGSARFNKRMLNPLGRIKSLQICQIMTKHISAHPLNSFRAKKESVSFIRG